jgi:hypothetical protein
LAIQVHGIAGAKKKEDREGHGKAGTIATLMRTIAEATYKIANLRGLSVKTGNKKKQSMKQTAAPKLHAPNISMRSHRLTIRKVVSVFPCSIGLHINKHSNESSRRRNCVLITWILRNGVREDLGIGGSHDRIEKLTSKESLFFFPTSGCR